MGILEADQPGSDAWWRNQNRRIDEMQRQLDMLRASVGRFGQSFTENGIVVRNGGSIVGEGGGELDWSGDAHFGGDLDIDGTTSISGTLNLEAGIIGDNALASLVRAQSYRTTRTSYRPVQSAFNNIVSVSVSPPSWATTVQIMAVATYAWAISGTGGTPYGWGRVAIGSSTSPDLECSYGALATCTGSIVWSETRNTSSNFDVHFQARSGDTSFFTANSDANAVLSVQCLYLRG